jgi:hypothetical protein
MRFELRSSSGVFLAVCLCLVLGFSLAASGQYRQLSTVHDGSGTMSSGGTYTNWSAAGQPGGIAVSSGGSMTNYAGFLHAVDIKRSSQDTDGDGIIDELDTDNDADGLLDTAEVAGSQFSPATATLVNNADSDGDGVTDGGEQAAATDPTDNNANLRILNIRNQAGSREVSYLARSEKNYKIRSRDGSYTYPTNELGSDSESGGAGAWLVRTNTFADAASTTSRFYAVEPVP